MRVTRKLKRVSKKSVFRNYGCSEPKQTYDLVNTVNLENTPKIRIVLIKYKDIRDTDILLMYFVAHLSKRLRKETDFANYYFQVAQVYLQLERLTK